MATTQELRSNPEARSTAMKPKPHTLNDIFFSIVDRNAPDVMLTRQFGAWTPISSKDLYRRVVGTANALRSWGFGHGDRIAILSENRPEWAIADFATLLIGAAVVPIYSTLTQDQALYVLQHSGARAIFLSSQKQVEKFSEIASRTKVERVIVMDDVTAVPDASMSLDQMSHIMNAGPTARDTAFDSSAHAITRDVLATVIYTSGTTGIPKGAMLTHGN